jgi:hypothetical protein
VGYRLLIILVIGLHYLFIAAAVFGGAAVLLRPRLAWFHVPIFLWAGLVAILSWTCPLTLLENALRVRAGWQTYSGGFLGRYLNPGLDALGLHRLVPYLGYFVLGLNVGLYAALIVQMRRSRRAPPELPGGAID